MGYFAKIENNMVVQVNAVEKDFFNANPERYTGQWVQTSYNTRGGVHYNPETNEPSEDQTKALRKNYASIGMIYDEQRDAFYFPKPYPSWILNEDTCQWEAPIPEPSDNKQYQWDEITGSWKEIIF
jgi:hypothetical protein